MRLPSDQELRDAKAALDSEVLEAERLRAEVTGIVTAAMSPHHELLKSLAKRLDEARSTVDNSARGLETVLRHLGAFVESFREINDSHEAGARQLADAKESISFQLASLSPRLSAIEENQVAMNKRCADLAASMLRRQQIDRILLATVAFGVLGFLLITIHASF